MEIKLNKEQWKEIAVWWDTIGKTGQCDGGIILNNKYNHFERVIKGRE